jgi:hypothetical protein
MFRGGNYNFNRGIGEMWLEIPEFVVFFSSQLLAAELKLITAEQLCKGVGENILSVILSRFLGVHQMW